MSYTFLKKQSYTLISLITKAGRYSFMLKWPAALVHAGWTSGQLPEWPKPKRKGNGKRNRERERERGNGVAGAGREQSQRLDTRIMCNYLHSLLIHLHIKIWLTIPATYNIMLNRQICPAPKSKSSGV